MPCPFVSFGNVVGSDIHFKAFLYNNSIIFKCSKFIYLTIIDSYGSLYV